MIATIHANGLFQLLHRQYDLGLRMDIVEQLAEVAHSVGIDRNGTLHMYVPADQPKLIETMHLVCQGRPTANIRVVSNGDIELLLAMDAED